MRKQLAALLWKEWRQQRALFAALILGGGIWLAAAWAMSLGGAVHRELVRPAAALYFLIAGGTLAATAFAGERRSGNLEFLAEKPVRPAHVWLAKLLAVLASCLVLVATVGGGACLLEAPPRGLVEETLRLWPHVLAAVVCSCFLASAGLRHPMFALLLGAAGIVLVVMAFVTYPCKELERGWAAALVSALLLGASWVIFSRVRRGEPSAWRRRRAVVGAYAALFSAVILTHVLGLYVAYWRIGPQRAAPLSYVASPLGVSGVSPDGRTVAFEEKFAVLFICDFVSRCLLVDVETGELRMLANPSCNSMPLLFPPWSPDGRFFLYGGYDHFLLHLLAPLHELKLLKEDYPSTATARVLDMRTGHSHELPHSVAGLVIFARWLDEADLLVLDRATRPWVYNAENRTLRPVKLLGRHQGCSTRVLRLRTQRIGLRLLREDGPWGPLFLYDREAGEWVPHPLPEGTRVVQMSDDGRYAVLWRLRGERTDPLAKVEYELADLAGGTRRLIGEVSHEDWLKGGKRFRFSPPGRWLACAEWSPEAEAASGVRLYDLATGQDKTIAKGRVPCRLRFSPSGRWLLFDEEPRDPYWDQGVWAYDLETEDLRKVVEDRWLVSVRSTADDTKLVWCLDDERPGLRVLDLANGRAWTLRPDLRDRGRVDSWDYAVLEEGVVFLVVGRRGLAVYRIGWDGTGQERIYPRDGD